MVPSSPQLAPLTPADPMSATGSIGPPSPGWPDGSASFTSFAPIMKPRYFPSGEKNGCDPPSEPGMTCGAVSSSRRQYSRCCSLLNARYTRPLPSGASARWLVPSAMKTVPRGSAISVRTGFRSHHWDPTLRATRVATRITSSAPAPAHTSLPRRRARDARPCAVVCPPCAMPRSSSATSCALWRRASGSSRDRPSPTARGRAA